jgi:hypothetical protein
MDRIRHRIHFIDRRRPGVVVVDPERPCRTERNAPGVYQVGVLALRVEVSRLIVRHQVGLAEQLVFGHVVFGKHVELKDCVRRIQERDLGRADGIGQSRPQVTHHIAPPKVDVAEPKARPIGPHTSRRPRMDFRPSTKFEGEISRVRE